MISIPNPKQPDPHDLAVTALVHAYEQIGRVGEQLPGRHEHFSNLEQDPGYDPSDHQKRPAVAASRDTRAMHGLIGLLFAACVCVAAFAWQSPYGRAAKLVIAPWAPQHVSTSPLSFGSPAVRSSPHTVGAATVDAALSQPAGQALLAQRTAQEAASVAPMSPELAQGLKTMASDLANVDQRIEQLKTSQEQLIRDNADLAEQLRATQAQMARDNANAAEQIKASQEQMARLVAKASEQNQPLRRSAIPPRPIAPPTHRVVSSPQARAQPRAGSQPEKQ